MLRNIMMRSYRVGPEYLSVTWSGQFLILILRLSPPLRDTQDTPLRPPYYGVAIDVLKAFLGDDDSKRTSQSKD